jgi:hypothetical protein
MRGLAKAETIRVLTRRSAWAVIAGGLAFVALGLVPMANEFKDSLASGSISVGQASGELAVSAYTMYLFGVFVGAMVATGDNRSKMSARIRRLAPLDGVILAKGIAAAGAGAIAGVLAAVTAILAAWLSLRNLGYGFELAGSPLVFVARHALHVALGGVWGVALGFLLRSTAVAILFQLAFQPLVENWVINSRPSIGRWLPGGAESAVVGDPTLAARLGFLAGLAVLVGWIATMLVTARTATHARLAR